ncbi:hypothetical protein JAAARDRAFT_47794 [Jaapia argillacea MUCL 33604]|uniref:Uncharacterized protein n=1 Tax=Jaapia argillacea MUCL 33604 TaxID=933084 RepID=A0A067PQW1_9AGAM|nr:hypothetical protein JAAARDRAFT_47794 [Jaapia argillacea MUCL 33604]
MPTTKHRVPSRAVVCEFCHRSYQPQGIHNHCVACEKAIHERDGVQTAGNPEPDTLNLVDPMDIEGPEPSGLPIPREPGSPEHSSERDNASNEQGMDEYIRVDYHPRSRKLATKIPLQVSGQEADPLDLEDDLEPWRPFRTCHDMLFTEKVVRLNLSNPDAEDLLQFVKSSSDAPSYVTLANVDEMYSILNHAVSNYASFHFHAEKKYKISGDKSQQFWDEPWTGEKWWRTESRLPDGGILIGIILWSDKGLLSSFGGRKGYPVVAQCANLPSTICNSEGFGGGRLVGWLPILGEEAGSHRKKTWTNHRREVWHTAFSHIISSLVPLSETGYWFKCGHIEVPQHFFPSIYVMSLDYEEQAIATLTRGSSSLAGCPSCEQPAEEFDQLGAGNPRNSKAYQRIWCQGEEMTHEDWELLYKPIGLVHMMNCFWSLHHTDIYTAMGYEVLHADELGTWKRIWKYLLERLELMPKEAGAQVEERISSLPSWSYNDTSTFAKVLSMDFADGTKYSHLLRIILHGIHPEFECQDQLLLKLIHSKAILHIYACLKVQTEERMTCGRKEVENFANLLHESQVQYGWMWKTPKVHALLAHLFDNIVEKGVTQNFNAKVNEKLQGAFKKAAVRFNESEKMKVEADSWISSQLPQKPNHIKSIGHIKLRGKGRHLMAGDLPSEFTQDVAFHRFTLWLHSFLTQYFHGSGQIPPGEKIILGHDGRLQEWFEVQIFYASEEDWRLCRDILHFKHNYRNHDRFDLAFYLLDFSSFLSARLEVSHTQWDLLGFLIQWTGETGKIGRLGFDE